MSVSKKNIGFPKASKIATDANEVFDHPDASLYAPVVSDEASSTKVFDTGAHVVDMGSVAVKPGALTPAFLYVEQGPGAGQLIQINPGKLVVGRASFSDLRLLHTSISRRHAQLHRIGERFFIKDLGSQNGTFLNEVRIEDEIEVFPGDKLALGNAILKLRGPGAKALANLPEVEADDPETIVIQNSKTRVSMRAVSDPSIHPLALPLDDTPIPVPSMRGFNAARSSLPAAQPWWVPASIFIAALVLGMAFVFAINQWVEISSKNAFRNPPPPLSQKPVVITPAEDAPTDSH